jgi:hypothetical protein
MPATFPASLSFLGLLTLITFGTMYLPYAQRETCGGLIAVAGVTHVDTKYFLTKLSNIEYREGSTVAS